MSDWAAVMRLNVEEQVLVLTTDGRHFSGALQIVEAQSIQIA